MKSFLLPIVLFFWCLPCCSFAQFANILQIAKQSDGYTALCLNLQNVIQDNDYFLEENYPTIEGFSITTFSFPLKRHENYYHLKILRQGDRICLSKLEQGRKEAYWIQDDALLGAYIDLHNNRYAANKSRVDIRREFTSDHMFSAGCGIGGDPTKYWLQMEEYVQRNKYSSIRTMLVSTNLEIQAYGAIGVQRMINNGVVVPEKDRELLKFLLHRNTGVVTCVGCIPGEVFGLEKLVSWYVPE